MNKEDAIQNQDMKSLWLVGWLKTYVTCGWQ